MLAQGAITSRIDKLFSFLLDTDNETAEIFIRKLPKNYFNKETRYFDILRLFLEKNIKIIPIGYINKIKSGHNRIIREYKINPKSSEDKYKYLNEDTEFVFLGIRENFNKIL